MDYLPLLSDATPVCEPPLSFGSVIILVIISCVLGLLWAAFNFMSVKKINVESDQDAEADSLIGGVTEQQRKLLIELGEKISNVKIFFIVGCGRVLEARVLDLFGVCFRHVFHHSVLHRRQIHDYQRYYLDGHCFRGGSNRFNLLWCHRYVDRHPNQLQNYLLR